ncbi:UV excision repair protein Rad23 [Carpediemonas membranifera]|uniref:UV excision repair protein RAD23 n=1 Tax=Carpediemonas membranifera TaxID=201153 RepID=A0A8J6BHH4_9EUKA|nr:UV excision repair protein Rad23 [Carpediemonas membranifera]|eukprot:KAG9397572.1 UV excision repair protein Rad23 [Carpediemonas membranifera]
MHVEVMTIKSERKSIDISPTATLDEVKAAVEAAFGSDYAAKNVKLICRGAILSSGTLESNNVTENSQLVVMGITKKVAPKKPESTPAPAPQPVAETPAQPVEETPAAASGVAAPPAETPVPQAPASTRPEEAATPADNVIPESLIEQVMEMGFERSQCEIALRAANMNVELAIDFLLSGNIPSSAPAPAPAPATQHPTISGSTFPPSFAGAAPEDDGAFPSLSGDVQTSSMSGVATPAMEEFLGDSRLEGLREALLQDPQLMQELLIQLSETNPELVQEIQAHPDMFLQLLQSTVQGEQGGEGGEGGQEVIQLTADDVGQIVNIAEIYGLPRRIILSLYIQCNRNADVVANVVIDRMDELRAAAASMTGPDLEFPSLPSQEGESNQENGDSEM